ncbi:50S ribosomal protein L25/general stress protein Ctc [Marivirga sp. S37H4]|uniref:Large ribosomal subunit protein bL25 n=1 Tax=Marivirga aurantiaca TaxID=2802615 RepID=A0A934WWR0_9BACT|nr:50S ribosomal protein L25/general stress protein Ctc [Marivirga aurantiaca]MBK6264285.1 50S ribosomal protein L25/general stress protein Ctc [Marivirga aurantiaca]
MKTVEIIGYKRANLGKKEAKRLRAEAMVPAVIYGGEKQVHFYAPMILFRPLVYTGEAHFVNLNIEGEQYQAILQDISFHPVNELILHADFLELHKGKPIKMNIPVHLTGTAPGVTKGGTLIHKRRALTLKALPKDMPEFIEVDISHLDFGKAVKVESVSLENIQVLDTAAASIAVVEIPRALRGKTAEDEAEAIAEAAADDTESEPIEG